MATIPTRARWLATLCAVLCVNLSLASAQDRGEELTRSYHELAAKQDLEGLAALWKANPDVVLPTIDADLEASLRMRETSDSPDEDAVAALHRRALFGARAAEAASGHPILVEYASSFVGWDADQRKRFRAGQAAFGRARKASKSDDHEAALAAAVECRQLAEPLGDWWGTAMGFGAEGQALAALGRHEDALVALSRARLINHDLGLFGSGYRNLLGMLEVLGELGREARLETALRQAVVAGESLGDEAGVTRLRARIQRLFPELSPRR